MYLSFINTDNRVIPNSVKLQSKLRRTDNVEFDLLLPFEWFMYTYLSSMDLLSNDEWCVSRAMHWEYSYTSMALSFTQILTHRCCESLDERGPKLLHMIFEIWVYGNPRITFIAAPYIYIYIVCVCEMWEVICFLDKVIDSPWDL